MGLKEAPQAFGRTYHDEKLLSPEYWIHRLRDKNIKIYASEYANDLVAIGTLQFSDNELIKHIATLQGFYVHPGFRNSGIGATLMKKIISDVKELGTIKKIRLSVNKTQVAAIRLYLKFGFKKTGFSKYEIRINNKYIDQYQMELIL